MLDRPHRRLNVLTGDWVCISPHRTQRPWQGAVAQSSVPSTQHYDPQCYLCPGNTRANGVRNPKYESTFVFSNDFPAFLPTYAGPEHSVLSTHYSALLRAEALSGECRVLCFSPRHELTLAQMTRDQIRAVVDLWAQQAIELGARYRWVQIFENKGELMGCSNPHPHGQVWASDFLPNEPTRELARQREWFERNGIPLLLEYAGLELKSGERVIVQTDHWVAVIPWWAVWPFETLILPRRHVLRLPDLDDAQRDDLAAILKTLLSGYDHLFDTSFPYSMGWHQAPNEHSTQHSALSAESWQLHAHIYPPLLRSATVNKFYVEVLDVNRACLGIFLALSLIWKIALSISIAIESTLLTLISSFRLRPLSDICLVPINSRKRSAEEMVVQAAGVSVIGPANKLLEQAVVFSSKPPVLALEPGDAP